MRKPLILLGVLLVAILLIWWSRQAGLPASGENFLPPGTTPPLRLSYATDLPPANATQAVGENQTQQAAYNLPTLDPQEDFPIMNSSYDRQTIFANQPTGKIAGNGLITELQNPYVHGPYPNQCEQNGWKKNEPNDYVLVWSCVKTVDLAQATMLVAIQGDKSNMVRVQVNSPQRLGPLHIIDASGDRLILQSDQGQTFYFDVSAQAFVNSLGQVVPTATPVPTNTPSSVMDFAGTDDARDIPSAVFDFSPVNADLSYFINSPTDIDWFRFKVLAPGTITVSLRQTPGSSALLVVRLDDSNMGTATPVGGDASPVKGNKTVTIKNATVGEYMVRVNSLDGSFSPDRPYVLRFDAPSPQKIVPILKCVSDNGNGTFNAYWGYQNPNPITIALEPGSKDNRFQPKPEVRTGQPVVFVPGLVEGWFGIQFDGNELYWELDGNIAKADRNSPKCP